MREVIFEEIRSIVFSNSRFDGEWYFNGKIKVVDFLSRYLTMQEVEDFLFYKNIFKDLGYPNHDDKVQNFISEVEDDYDILDTKDVLQSIINLFDNMYEDIRINISKLILKNITTKNNCAYLSTNNDVMLPIHNGYNCTANLSSYTSSTHRINICYQPDVSVYHQMLLTGLTAKEYDILDKKVWELENKLLGAKNE